MCFLFVDYVSRLFSIYCFFSLPFIGFPITSQNARKKKQQKIQNPDQKAPKRVCPTSVSARPSAQQLRPQRLKHLNPLLPFSLMCSLPNFFLVIKAVVFYMEFWFMTGLPQESRQFFVVFCFLQIHQHSEQNVKLEITQKVCKVWLINVLFPKKSGKNGWEKSRESFFTCIIAG